MPRSKHNDEERRQWVLSDEGLYNLMREDHPGKLDGEYSVRNWVKKNRAMIDEVIKNVISGRKQSPFLKYGW